MKNEWAVMVRNVGTVWRGTDGFRAINEYRTWVNASKQPHGRGSNEEVVLTKNGEPHREYYPDAGWFYIEITDTFGGEANYCWVHRFKVKAKTHASALTKTKYSTGWRFDWDMCDELGTKRFNLRRAAICAFVSHWSTEYHHERYTGINTIE